MIDLLTVLLRLAGTGLIALALLHIPIARKLRWREELQLISPPNAAIFKVHAFFICLVEVLMGLPCLLEPAIFLTPTRAGAWLAWAFAFFWGVRLYFQFFIYTPDLRHGKRLESALHWWFALVWLSLTGLYAACGAIQSGWLHA
jgi:hypothetical protein